MNNQNAIETQALTKRYDEEVLAVDGVDLAIATNSIFALLGPNGAGKTTTIAMLTTLIELNANLLGWLAGFLLIAGYGIGFSGIALAVASKTDSADGYHMMIFMLQLPLLFWSNSLYPLATLPTWMRIGAMFNPTTYVVTGLRTITMAPAVDVAGIDSIPMWACFVVIAAFAAVGMGLALRAFRSTIK